MRHRVAVGRISATHAILPENIINETRFRPGGGETISPRRWQFDPKIAADLRPSADGPSVRTSLVAGGG